MSPPVQATRRARVRAAIVAALPGWRGRALYAFLSVPLGAAYVAMFAGLVVSVVLSVNGIGVVMFFALLATARGFGGLERRLARGLLRLDVAADVVQLRYRSDQVVRRLRALALLDSTWRTLGWLGVRVLLAAGIVATLAFCVTAQAALVVFGLWSPWTALPLIALMAVVVGLVVAALELQVRLAALIASRLLGTTSAERIAALQHTSQRLADRNRLARDLHDTIGHALTASLLQATAAGRTLAPSADDAGRPVDLDFARQALAHIETNTRTALAELDRALAVLRDEASADAQETAPDLTYLDGLLAGLRDGGLPVESAVDVAVEEVPAELSTLAFRVVQEGTTNVLRHAGLPPTTVQVVRTGDTLTVRVRNRPSGLLESRPGPGGGRGLTGLRDRTAAVGGHLACGPTPGGGFELCATLPLARPA